MFAQTSTFDFKYTQFGNTTVGFSVKQVNNGNYLVSGYHGSNLIVTKINESGTVIWEKEFAANNIFQNNIIRQYPLEVASDSNILLVSTKIINDNEDVLLLKLNQDGDTLWTKTLGDDSREFGSSIIELSNGNLFVLVSIMSGFSFKNAKLIKTDMNGNMISSKLYLLPGFNNQGYGFAQMNDSIFVISGKNKLIAINDNGDSLWVKDIAHTVNSIGRTNDNGLIVGENQYIEKIVESGNIEWTLPIDGNIQSVIATNDNGFLFCLHGDTSYIFKTDENGTEQWKSEILGNCYGMDSTSDGYIITGELDNFLRLLKTDIQGTYNSLHLIIPPTTQTYNFTPLKIRWFSGSQHSIDLSYSDDNGNTWLPIVFNYSGEFSYYYWLVPNLNNSDIFIRINDSSIPELTDTMFFKYSQSENPNYDAISVNNVTMWISNNGGGSHNPITDGGGYYWSGTAFGGVSSIFEDGLVYGGIVDSVVNVSGSTYRHGWQPGIILPNGEADNPENPKYKIWKIRKDWETLPPGQVRGQYEYDYNNWPVDLGAPWKDIDGDGIYTQGVDKPDFIGDEVLYYVANDLDAATTNFVYGSPPIGLEFHVTVWGYNRDNFLRDVVFKKYQIINKGKKTVEDMYCSYWADDDLGLANDDFVGCDSVLNLGFVYNGDNNDDNYFGVNPPALGHMMVQGPIVEASQSDSAKVNGKWRRAHRNLPLTSFTAYICGGTGAYCMPELGSHSGAVQFYNNLQGLDGLGNPIINPVTGKITVFSLSGDPVNQTGWFEGEGWPNGYLPGDRYYLISSGPLTFAPGDTQEVVYAIFVAQGSDNIHSISELKNTAKDIQYFYDHSIYTDINDGLTKRLPTKFELYQNYPNPFNPTTIIKYKIPGQAWNDNINVSLKIYDVLGREVAILVNKKQKPGDYKVEFNASQLPSGVYFYRLKTGSFVKTRKIVLIK